MTPLRNSPLLLRDLISQGFRAVTRTESQENTTARTGPFPVRPGEAEPIPSCRNEGHARPVIPPHRVRQFPKAVVQPAFSSRTRLPVPKLPFVQPKRRRVSPGLALISSDSTCSRFSDEALLGLSTWLDKEIWQIASSCSKSHPGVTRNHDCWPSSSTPTSCRSTRYTRLSRFRSSACLFLGRRRSRMSAMISKAKSRHQRLDSA